YAPTESWQKSVVAFFRKQTSTWQRMPGFTGLSLKRHNENGRHFYPIAMDMGKEEQGAAFLTMIYSDQEASGLKTAVTWRLHPLKSFLSLITDPLQEHNAQHDLRQQWSVRLEATVQEIEKGFSLEQNASRRDQDYKTKERFYNYIRFNAKDESVAL